jgi:hypothetical protein
LGGTIEYETHWRRLIDRCRQHFDGPLTYAASWDEADRVEFWDAIDVVGVDAYFPITERADADRSDMLAGWQPWLQHLEALHQSSGRQVLLTEIGYRSIDGAGMHPYRFGDTGPYDPTEQADLYWAALEATGDVSWIDGIVWWNWLARGGGGPNDLDFTPVGKPALDQLSAAWRPR